MSGEKDLNLLLTHMEPVHQPGNYVFVSVPTLDGIDPAFAVMTFREAGFYHDHLFVPEADAAAAIHVLKMAGTAHRR
jgi:hypothetical protein